MNQIIRTGFQPITYAIEFEPEKIRKGKDLSKTHVMRVEELQGIEACKLIRCSCIRSFAVTKKPYAVNVDLDEHRFVTHTTCTCVSGLGGKCKHIYALIHYVNTDRGLTKSSYEQGWGRPSDSQLGKDIYAKPLVLAEKYVPNDNYNNVKPYEVTLEDLAEIDYPLRNILKVENLKKEELIAEAQAIALLKQQNEQKSKANTSDCVMLLLENSPREEQLYSFYLKKIDPAIQAFFDSKVKLSHRQVFDVCINTVNQSENDLWFDVRKIRISASSKVHKIKTRIRKTSEDLAKDFLNSNKNSQSTAAQEYGIKNEKIAVKEYVERFQKTVRHVGVFIMPLQPWLCGSPDGIVLENDQVSKILEIKCPSTCRYKPIFDSSVDKFNVGYLAKENGTTCLKKSHEYYTQCQVLMYITGLRECDLYVWSPKGSELVAIPRDDEYLKKVIPKVEDFYFNEFLPVLYGSEKENAINNSNQ